MSDLQSKQLAADLLAETLARKPQPSAWLFWLGVVYPAAVIAFELATRWCAESFFDPMPTIWHTLAISAVPAGNLMLWLTLRGEAAVSPKSAALLSGFTIGIAAFYALIFLPMLPLAVIAVIFYGLGFLPMAPLVSMISALKLSQAYRKRHAAFPARTFMAGIAAAVILLFVLDIPSAATRLGVQWAASSDRAERERGLALLRTAGDDDLLLRLCYDAVGRPSGLLSALVMFGGRSLLDAPQRQLSQSTAEIREIYYRVHGVPFNAKPAPFQTGTWARTADFQWDSDHGGTQVGGRVKGLDLVSSRLDGSISAADATSYLEWVVEFRNASPLDREARIEFALPPGGVVSRATLWVNGEEREAAYGGRGAVRAAYEQVAVIQRRDPLLVTTKGAGRVLAQAFPVPRDGGTIKFKIGITAPLGLDNASSGRFVLPAIVDRNFSFADNVNHAVWIESKTPLSAPGLGLKAQQVSPGLYRITASLSDTQLARERPAIFAERPPTAGSLAARIGQGDEIVQTIVTETSKAPDALMIVIDGSARLATLAAPIANALDKIPAGTPAGILIASEPAPRLEIASWSEDTKRRAMDLLKSTTFTGGQDNTRALADALLKLEPYNTAALIWIHGPQPVAFRETASVLEQAASRLVRRPHVWLLATEPGPNQVLPDLPWAWTARAIPSGGKIEADLAEVFSRELFGGPKHVIHRVKAAPYLASDKPAEQSLGSEHIARLWAADQILAMMSEANQNRAAAVALATDYHLVTPVSGAVVLETQQQFEANNLTAANKATVPTVPEPEEWALMIIAALALLWMMRQQKQVLA